MKRSFLLHFVMVAAGLILLAGCAPKIPPPKEEVALSRAAVEQAERGDAYSYAPVELTKAQEKLNRALAAMEERDYLQARRLAEQAKIDADLAYLKARSAKAQEATRQLQETIETLRRELTTSQPSNTGRRP